MVSSIVSFTGNLLQLYPYSLLTPTPQTESNPVLYPGRPIYIYFFPPSHNISSPVIASKNRDDYQQVSQCTYKGKQKYIAV